MEWFEEFVHVCGLVLLRFVYLFIGDWYFVEDFV